MDGGWSSSSNSHFHFRLRFYLIYLRNDLKSLSLAISTLQTLLDRCF